MSFGTPAVGPTTWLRLLGPRGQPNQQYFPRRGLPLVTSSPGNLAAFRSDPPFIGPVTWLEDGVLNFVALYRRVAQVSCGSLCLLSGPLRSTRAVAVNTRRKGGVWRIGSPLPNTFVAWGPPRRKPNVAALWKQFKISFCLFRHGPPTAQNRPDLPGTGGPGPPRMSQRSWEIVGFRCRGGCPKSNRSNRKLKTQNTVQKPAT